MGQNNNTVVCIEHMLDGNRDIRQHRLRGSRSPVLDATDQVSSRHAVPQLGLVQLWKPMEEAQVITITEAAALLGYSRSSIYARLNDGSLTRGSGISGKSGVTVSSAHAYLANPPARARPRGSAPASVAFPATPAVDHRETVSRLQMVREAEARSRAAERRAAKHLRKALRWQQTAALHQATASREMDSLLVQLMTPNSLLDLLG